MRREALVIVDIAIAVVIAGALLLLASGLAIVVLVAMVALALLGITGLIGEIRRRRRGLRRHRGRGPRVT